MQVGDEILCKEAFTAACDTALISAGYGLQSYDVLVWSKLRYLQEVARDHVGAVRVLYEGYRHYQLRTTTCIITYRQLEGKWWEPIGDCLAFRFAHIDVVRGWETDVGTGVS